MFIIHDKSLNPNCKGLESRVAPRNEVPPSIQVSLCRLLRTSIDVGCPTDPDIKKDQKRKQEMQHKSSLYGSVMFRGVHQSMEISTMYVVQQVGDISQVTLVPH